MIRIYNTLSGEKESLTDPKDQRKIRMFVCGPTVYDYLHIGNARTYIFFDFFAKYLSSQGYEVQYLQNITDIDDKIIKRGAEENKTPEEIATFFTEAYLEDMKALGVTAVTQYAPATQFITQIIAQVERLIAKGFAYKIDDDGWYFDISKDEDYGKLSHRTTEQAEDGTSRIDESISKRNKGDFCLWKFSKHGEPSWPGLTLGDGRPGWHIEDTAISEFYFGPQYDIHGGGVDLKFPHHEAEIAQQESASGLKPFVATWMHTGALLVDGKKMSKSLGNFITIRDFLKKYPPEVLRWLTLKHDYRSPIDYSEQSAREAEINLYAIRKFLGKLKMAVMFNDNQTQAPFDIKSDIEERYKVAQKFFEEDINTASLLAEPFWLMNQYAENIWKINSVEAQVIMEQIEKILHMLGFSTALPEIPLKIQQLGEKRDLSRANQQFEQSDTLRKEMNALGYEVEDTPKGSFLWPKE
jgi:cysteinyl-tRNA synthetase